MKLADAVAAASSHLLVVRLLSPSIVGATVLAEPEDYNRFDEGDLNLNNNPVPNGFEMRRFSLFMRGDFAVRRVVVTSSFNEMLTALKSRATTTITTTRATLFLFRAIFLTIPRIRSRLIFFFFSFFFFSVCSLFLFFWFSFFFFLCFGNIHI
jgi:hypothetical protein